METKSRYDFMLAGEVQDEVTDNLYPDPLSINYFNFTLEEMPQTVKLDNMNINFIWKIANDVYGVPAWDDMVLSLNGVPHINFLKPGDILYFPSVDEIKKSFVKE